MDHLFDLRLNFLGHLVEYIGRLMHPAALLGNARVYLTLNRNDAAERASMTSHREHWIRFFFKRIGVSRYHIHPGPAISPALSSSGSRWRRFFF